MRTAYGLLAIFAAEAAPTAFAYHDTYSYFHRFALGREHSKCCSIFIGPSVAEATPTFFYRVMLSYYQAVF